jgi:uncharacterized protein YjbI with pentapeptide repeats
MARRQRSSINGMEPPALGRLATHGELTADDLAVRDGISGVSVSGGDLAGHAADDLAFERVSAARLVLSQSQLARVQWSDCRLEGCDLAGATWEQAYLLRTELRGCRMLGVNWIGARLDQVLLQQCNATAAQLWEIRCRQCVFERCQLADASFEGASLAGAVFRDCDLSNANMQGAALTDADLRGSTISGLRVRPEDVRGLILDAAQAVQLAQLFGVRVLAADETR